MSDPPSNQESGAGEPKPPKMKAEDNPWYLLATLYGEREQGDRELTDKNRTAWNRYFAADLDEETRTKLIEKKWHTTDELTPFSPEELEEVRRAFARRCTASGKDLALPASGDNIEFSHVEFEQRAFFEGYLFSRASFQGATFSGRASFGGATFYYAADFSGATFSRGADFNGATFSAPAHFSGANFSDMARFGGATFSGDTYFFGATFSRIAYFIGATFSARAYHTAATFSDMALFGGATFSGMAEFDDAKFQRSSSFVNAEMKDTTSFAGAIFKTEPPKFFGAKLHQGTVWRGIKWPPKPKDKKQAGAFMDAYACLKLEMDRLKKHEDELVFFVLEMQSRRVLLGSWGGWPIWLYELLSCYGRSYIRPLVALFVVSVIGAGAFWYFDARTFGEALGLSVANTLNVFGFRRDFNLSVDTPLAWLTVLTAAQTILGTILLFLFGLGIRNKFRIK